MVARACLDPPIDLLACNSSPAGGGRLLTGSKCGVQKRGPGRHSEYRKRRRRLPDCSMACSHLKIIAGRASPEK